LNKDIFAIRTENLAAPEKLSVIRHTPA